MYRNVCAHVVHTLRCHFITTTELSKNTQPTRCSNWRNHQSSNLAERCQQVKKPFSKLFFGPFSAALSLRRPVSPAPCCQHPNWLLNANPNYIGRNALSKPHQQNISPFSCQRRNTLLPQCLRTCRRTKPASSFANHDTPWEKVASPRRGSLVRLVLAASGESCFDRKAVYCPEPGGCNPRALRAIRKPCRNQ